MAETISGEMFLCQCGIHYWYIHADTGHLNHLIDVNLNERALMQLKIMIDKAEKGAGAVDPPL